MRGVQVWITYALQLTLAHPLRRQLQLISCADGTKPES